MPPIALGFARAPEHLIPQQQQDEAFVAQPSPPYDWPRILNLKPLTPDLYPSRREQIRQEMQSYSKRVGAYGNDRAPFGATEKLWLDRIRMQNMNEVYKQKNVKSFCDAVKTKFVDTRLPVNPQAPSPFTQYGACEEGSMVGACLAHAFGIPANQIQICVSEKTRHQWALIPEKLGKIGSYCLLDRWNNFRCGVTLKTRIQDGVKVSVVKVPGQTLFSFGRSSCDTLEGEVASRQP